MTVYSAALTSLAAARQQLEQVATRTTRAGDADGNLDVAAEMVRLLTARSVAKNAVKLVETAVELEKATLDILA